MDMNELLMASKVVVQRNVDAHVAAATVSWNEETSTLILRYHIDRHPTDSDEEQCELALGELIAEFSDVALAVAECVQLAVTTHASDLEGLVFARG